MTINFVPAETHAGDGSRSVELVFLVQGGQHPAERGAGSPCNLSSASRFSLLGPFCASLAIFRHLPGTSRTDAGMSRSRREFLLGPGPLGVVKLDSSSTE